MFCPGGFFCVEGGAYAGKACASSRKVEVVAREGRL